MKQSSCRPDTRSAAPLLTGCAAKQSAFSAVHPLPADRSAQVRTNSLTTTLAVKQRQQGNAAIEFALIFPLLFLMFYGTFVYGYVFFLQQTMTFAAQQAAQAAVRVDPTGTDYPARIDAAVRSAAVTALDYLPDTPRTQLLGANGNAVAISIQPAVVGGTVRVTLTLNPSTLLPVISLPGIGALPPLPAQLKAVGTVGV